MEALSDLEMDFDFENSERTSNGRAVVLRKDIMHASPYTAVDRIDNFVLITRGPLVPAISKLTLEQAVAESFDKLVNTRHENIAVGNH